MHFTINYILTKQGICRRNGFNVVSFYSFILSLGYDTRGRQNDDDDSACPALLEREFHSLHRNVPGLRRAGVDANAIRQVNGFQSIAKRVLKSFRIKLSS